MTIERAVTSRAESKERSKRVLWKLCSRMRGHRRASQGPNRWLLWSQREWQWPLNGHSRLEVSLAARSSERQLVTSIGRSKRA